MRGDYKHEWYYVGDHGRAIPTCVGTTELAEVAVVAVTGHPHVRGDYNLERVKREKPFGPSPRAWGLPHLLPRYFLHKRAIPTCVGTTRER